MKVSVKINGVDTVVSALTYQFPKSPKVLKVGEVDYNLKGEDGKALTLAQTGGGKFPTYVYFKHEGVSHYLPKNVTPDLGSVITVVPEAAKPEVVKKENVGEGLAAAKKAERAPSEVKKVA
jgi:hypothetical protein